MECVLWRENSWYLLMAWNKWEFWLASLRPLICFRAALVCVCIAVFFGNLGEHRWGQGRVSTNLSPFFFLRQKKGNVAHKHWVGPSNLIKCKPCPVAQSAMVCGSDGHTYTSKVGLYCPYYKHRCRSVCQVSVL